MRRPISLYEGVFLIIVLLLSACVERKRTNIFDPAYPKPTVDAALEAIGNDSVIELKWHNPDVTAINSTRLFRRETGSETFFILAQIPSNQTTYTDTNVVSNINYQYYLTFVSADRASAPSKTVQATTGPGSIWALDIYAYEIQHFSYDLQQRDIRIAGIWQPEALAFDNDHQIGLVTYPIFKTYELVDLKTGTSLGSSDQSGAPVDAAYNPARDTFWLVDSTSGLYEISTDNINGSRLGVRLDRPEQIVKVNQNYFIVQSAGRSIIRLDENGTIQDSIGLENSRSTYQNISLMRAAPEDNALFFLNNYHGKGQLFRYDLLDDSIKTIYSDTTIFSFDIDSKQSTIWIVKPEKLNSLLVQLSINGLRLQEQDGFIRPTDVRINPYNGNILITDIGSGKVYHYAPDLNLIGSFQSNGQPYKVYIE